MFGFIKLKVVKIMRPLKFILYLLVCFTVCNSINVYAKKKKNKVKGVYSIDTGYTITKVRIAKNKNQSYVLASSYNGVLLGVDLEGKTLWKNKLSGFMNHDIWAGDVDNDGVDEIFAANANGTLYCLNNKGQLLWKFKKNEAPMYAVCVVNNNGKPYVACGGYDTNLYYLSGKGVLINTVPSVNYSLEHPKSRRKDKIIPKYKRHITNFLRPGKHPEFGDVLIVHGVMNSMSGNGSVYVFKGLATKPFKQTAIKKKGPFGDVRIVDVDGDGYSELLMGRTGAKAKGITFCEVDTKTMGQKLYNTLDTKDNSLTRGMYRVIQTDVIKDGKDVVYFALVGSNIVLSSVDENNMKNAEVINTKYSFNDMVKNPYANQVVLASAQSGGSAIHILNLDSKSWKKDYASLNPPGKIQTILNNTAKIRKDFKNFKKSKDQQESAKVYFMSEKRKDPITRSYIDKIEARHNNPVFLNGGNFNKEVWDRSSMTSEIYKKKRDRRMKYNQSQQDILNILKKRYNQSEGGISYWGGHGNDPFMFQTATMVKGLGLSKGKKTVLIYPELEDHSKEFQYVIDNLFMPLAKKAKATNGSLYLRNKHLFWQSSVYLPKWNFITSGKYADVIVPAMEETTDKSMELSLASRIGLWSSGAVDSWGARCARDNASFDRLRQHSNQVLPNHFLRTMVYTLASGAQYIDNFRVDQKYMSFLWELIAEGALYVPKKSDILSFSPVHFGMISPDEEHLNEASNVKWLTFYNEEKNKEPFVFSRLNGTWPGAPLTEWDFSKYAAGNHERRLNFIPKYNNGLVLITPPQNGVYIDKDAVRKPLEENIHPFYKGKMKEYISNGKEYISSDGKTRYAADEYYKVVKNDIEKSAAKLPLTVKGNIGWVVAQVAPKVLRLTLVENGYINPEKAKAIITFNTITPKKITDILSKDLFKMNTKKEVEVEIPLGGFKFIDIELSKPLLD